MPPVGKRQVYLDAHASTPCDPRVAEAMWPVLLERYANASSPHRAAQRAAELVRDARETVAAALGAEPGEVIFTSGATESNNLAILGLAQGEASSRNRILTSPIEHKSVLESCRWLSGRGYEVCEIPVRRDGRVELDALASLLDDRVLLVSVQAASNEIGTIQPTQEIAELCQESGATLHCDAAQALGRVPIDVDAWRVDLLSISAHKCYGPKGVGALFVRGGPQRSDLEPVMFGGGHEGGLRPGTINTPGIVGFGRACEIVLEELEEDAKRLSLLRDWFEAALAAELPGLRRNGCLNRRLPGSSSLTFEHVEADVLIANLPEIALSGGSACTSAAFESSHVLRAIGLTDAEAARTVRIGVDRFATQDDLEYAAQRIAEAVGRLAAAG